MSTVLLGIFSSRGVVAQGPLLPAEIKAGEILLAALIPMALTQLQQWLASKPKDQVAKETLMNLQKQLTALSKTRQDYVSAVRDYLTALRATRTTSKSNDLYLKEEAANSATGKMISQLQRLQAPIDQLGVGLSVNAPDVESYRDAKGQELRIVGHLSSKTPQQRKDFEKQLDANGTAFDAAMKSLNSLLASKYSIGELMPN